MRRLIAAPALLLGAMGLAAEAGTANQVARACTSTSACRTHEVFVPAGVYMPFFKSGTETRAVPVEPICLSASAVTHEEFLGFVRDHPDWRKSRIKKLYAESSYLADWQDDLTPRPEMLSEPVTFVSWFAAGAYCEATGRPASDGRRMGAFCRWQCAGDKPRRRQVACTRLRHRAVCVCHGAERS